MGNTLASSKVYWLSGGVLIATVYAAHIAWDQHKAYQSQMLSERTDDPNETAESEEEASNNHRDSRVLKEGEGSSLAYSTQVYPQQPFARKVFPQLKDTISKYHSERALESALLEARRVEDRWKASMEYEDSCSIVAQYKAALRLCPEEHSSRAPTLNSLSIALQLQYRQTGSPTTLTESIGHAREALSLCPIGDPSRADIFENLSMALDLRYELTGKVTDATESIGHGLEALSLLPVGLPRRGIMLASLSSTLSKRYHRIRDIADLTESIERGREALSLLPVGLPLRTTTLGNLSTVLHLRYKQTSDLTDVTDLTESIGYYREALPLYPVDHPERDILLTNVIDALYMLHKQTRDVTDLVESIGHCREAISLHPVGHPKRHFTLGHLSSALYYRYRQTGNITDLAESIDYSRAALSISPVDHPDRATTLSNLSVALESRYNQTRDIIDLTDSIDHNREALTLLPVGIPDRATIINNLSVALDLRHKQTGNLADLTERISLGRKALSLCPVGHPNYTTICSNLSAALLSRYDQTGDVTDLTESIGHAREAGKRSEEEERGQLSLHPFGHADRAFVLINLANIVRSSYRQTGDLTYLTEGIDHGREALLLCPVGHIHRAGILNNLASALNERYSQTRDFTDLIEGICHGREALSLRSVHHTGYASTLNNLSDALHLRYHQTGDFKDLEESVSHVKIALSLLPDGHPDGALILSNLSLALESRYKKTCNLADLAECVAYLKKAVAHTLSPMSTRLVAASYWISTARIYDPESVEDAYSSAVTLLDRSVLLARSMHDRHARLTYNSLEHKVGNIAVDGASWAIEHHNLEGSVQLLEQGRGVMFNQLGNYRTSLDELDVCDKELGDRFRSVSAAIEKFALPDRAGQNDVAMSEDAVARYQDLAAAWDRIVEEIRRSKGFESFLRVTPFATLQKAAASGPVILINISQYRSDAIIIVADGKPLSVPLPEATPSALNALVLRLHQAVGGDLEDVKSNRIFKRLCQDIWRIITEPITLLLENTLKLAIGSHIWWVPASVACLLPIHASGPYLPGQLDLPDRFISSYAPSLLSLTRARTGYVPVKYISRLRLLVAAQAKPEGEPALPNVNREITAICQQAKNVAVLEGEGCTRDAVLASLKETEWVHFACHGHRNPTEPFKSYFSLRTRDAPLTLIDIISNGLPNAELAVLSACHSAAGDKTTPDEAIHLAAGMLFTGFRSVVGTMWAMDDRDGPVMAEAFYRHIFRNGPSEAVDCRDAAKALVMGVRELRRRKVPLERWINLVHYGI